MTAVVVGAVSKPKISFISTLPAAAAVLQIVFESFIFPIRRSHARVCSSAHYMYDDNIRVYLPIYNVYRSAKRKSFKK